MVLASNEISLEIVNKFQKFSIWKELENFPQTRKRISPNCFDPKKTKIEKKGDIFLPRWDSNPDVRVHEAQKIVVVNYWPKRSLTLTTLIPLSSCVSYDYTKNCRATVINSGLPAEIKLLRKSGK